MKVKDTIQRSLIKGITWRFLASLDTFLISYIVVGNSVIAGSIVGIEMLTKIFIYFLHERLWNVILWGRGVNGVSPLRSILKSISWRLWGTIYTMIIVYILTGELSFSFSIGGIEMFSKMLLYYIHERIWINIKWGRLIKETVL